MSRSLERGRVLPGQSGLCEAMPPPSGSTNLRLARVQRAVTARRQTLRKKPALFLDYDGTLVRIVRRPELATLKPEIRRLLMHLSRCLPMVIVSGRSLPDVHRRVGIKGIGYAGNHGLEISGPGWRYRMEGAARWRRLLRKVARGLLQELSNLPGILLEDKGSTLTVHYRQAGGAVRRQAAAILHRRLHPMEVGGRLRIHTGKAVWEIRPPVRWNKGEAVLWILKRPAFRGCWPIYIGDDRTDQDAFHAVRTKKGLGIMVGPARRRGAAHVHLIDPREVHRFLGWLLDSLGGSSPDGRKIR